MAAFQIIWLVLLFLLDFSHQRQELVKVSLYYESLCPFSREFLSEQLYTGYLQIKESLVVDLIPYGKANESIVNGRLTFTCQHGPKECLGNKFQACILAQQLPFETKFSFINCMMNSSNPASFSNGRKCSAENHFSWNLVSACIKSGNADKYLAHYGDRTRNADPKLRYVPYIFFNGEFNQTLENQARDDFLKTVCLLYNVKPKECDYFE